MTYLDILLLIEERKERALAQEPRFIITDKHRYIRQLDDPESAWQQDMEPGAPKEMYGKSGKYFIWEKTELPPEIEVK
jgi:hypothetical protein